MKKVILFILSICVASITINQILNSKTTKNRIETEISENLNQNDNEIAKLDQEYNTRTNQLNQAIKNNLVASITLINNKITINYQNLNPKLYSKDTYQMILSNQYLENLKTQYQFNLVSFDSNNHINFNEGIMVKHNPNFWKEWHWYWFVYWKLHLSNYAIGEIIDFIGPKICNLSPGVVTAISAAIAGLMSTILGAIVVGVIAAFLIISAAVLLFYSTNPKGCWLGVIGVIPGTNWGSN